MFKLFNVSKGDDHHGHSHTVEHRDTHAHHDHDDHHDIHVHHGDESDAMDIGQIALDIGESDEGIVILAPIAGVAMDSIDISLAKHILTIAGVRERPAIAQDFHSMPVEECFWGAFSRSIVLPENLALNKIKATMVHNLLQIEIPRLQFASKSIKIDRLTD